MSGLEASLLLGSIHSVVLATVLGRRTRRRRANRYLAALLGALSLLLDGVLRARGALAAYPHLIGLTAWGPFGKNDVVVRAGRLLDITGTSPLFPFYATLGYARRW